MRVATRESEAFDVVHMEVKRDRMVERLSERLGGGRGVGARGGCITIERVSDWTSASRVGTGARHGG